MEDSRDLRVGRTTSSWAGWVVFAGVMAVIVLIVHGRELADR
jgi:hypothetical protein